MKCVGSQDVERDVFKDSFVRYFGYTNEIGEAFRAHVHVKVVHLSYALASAYVGADAIHKGYLAMIKYEGHPKQRRFIAINLLDTLVWQGLASVLIPGFTINRICWVSNKLMSATTALPLPMRKMLATATGLLAIPFIIKPIDRSVDWGMNRSVRKWLVCEKSDL